MVSEYPVPTLLPQLRRLWKQAFGDSDAFLDLFFRLCYCPSRCRCITRNEEVLSALYWFDFTCRGQKMAYLYAVATREDVRHQGLCRKLLADTRHILEERGYSAVLLCPENDALARMYAASGYQPACPISQWRQTPAEFPVSLRRLSPDEYAQLRGRLLPEGGAQPDGRFFSLLAWDAELYAGEDFLLAARLQDGNLFALELLGKTDAASGILTALNCREGIFRSVGKDRNFAMFLPLLPDTQPPAYFGLALD